MSGNVHVHITTRLSLERSSKMREAAVSEECDYATRNEEVMKAFVCIKTFKEVMLFKAGQYEKLCDVTSMGIYWLCTFLKHILPSVHSFCGCDVNS